MGNVKTAEKSRKSKLLFIFFLFASSTVNAANTANMKDLMLFLGDSITAGGGVKPEQLYPARINTGLKGMNLNIQIENAAKAAEPLQNLSKRLPDLLKKKPRYVIIALGDDEMRRGAPVDQIQSQLASMIDSFKGQGSQVFLLGFSAVVQFGPQYKSMFDQMYPNFQLQKKVPLLPDLLGNVIGHKDLLQKDGIHPNAKGHEQISAKVLGFLIPHLQH